MKKSRFSFFGLMGMVRRTTAASLAAVLLLSGCLTLRVRTRNLDYHDASFWFSLDPTLLLLNTEGKIRSTFTGVDDFDALFLKCQILLDTLESGRAAELYSEQMLAYEIKMTIAMIDSRDPVHSFAGRTIVLAQPAYEKLLSQRKILLNYI